LFVGWVPEDGGLVEAVGAGVHVEAEIGVARNELVIGRGEGAGDGFRGGELGG